MDQHCEDRDVVQARLEEVRRRVRNADPRCYVQRILQAEQRLAHLQASAFASRHDSDMLIQLQRASAWIDTAKSLLNAEHASKAVPSDRGMHESTDEDAALENDTEEHLPQTQRSHAPTEAADPWEGAALDDVLRSSNTARQDKLNADAAAWKDIPRRPARLCSAQQHQHGESTEATQGLDELLRPHSSDAAVQSTSGTSIASANRTRLAHVPRQRQQQQQQQRRGEQKRTPGDYKSALTQTMRMHFKAKSVRLKGTDAACAVCLDDFEEKQAVRKLPCGCTASVLHEMCCTMWLQTGDTRCPVCRTDILQIR